MMAINYLLWRSLTLIALFKSTSAVGVQAGKSNNNLDSIQTIYQQTCSNVETVAAQLSPLQ